MKLGGMIAGALACVSAMIASPALAETIAIRAGNVVLDAESEPIGPALITIEDGVIVSIDPVPFTLEPAADEECRVSVAHPAIENEMRKIDRYLSIGAD